MPSPYFILAVRQTDQAPWEIVFGSGDRAAVVAKIDEHRGAYITHIQEAASDADEDVDAALDALGA